ncbi:hypothetical protein B0H21DRAFT_710749 [Amylocystis lapponica]|nr:hypothetical protein B0H21DRAFT_710749 [Amylocystis lapponica]
MVINATVPEERVFIQPVHPARPFGSSAACSPKSAFPDPQGDISGGELLYLAVCGRGTVQGSQHESLLAVVVDDRLLPFVLERVSPEVADSRAMSSLAFPAGPSFKQSEPLDHGRPFGGGPDDIPIDPALSGLQLDPALLGEVGNVEIAEAGVVDAVICIAQRVASRFREISLGSFPLPVPLKHVPIPPLRQYSQGPQGDPFAPQPSPTYLVAEEPAPPPSKPVKKRRHPSCMELTEISDVVRSYDWKCVDCKNCEVCQLKGDENRMVICDFCDRGWHIDCLEPPLIEPPPGKWHCPLCPPLPPPDLQPLDEQPATVLPLQTPNPFPESSVASSSHIVDGNQMVPEMLVTDESEVDVEGEATPSAGRNKSKKKSRWKGKAPMRNDVEGAASPSAGRTAKRMRIHLSSPAPPSQPVPVLRLRLPPRGKGKAREDDPEETKHGLFDDVLTPEDRDTASTSIASTDKQRFERSRLTAEEKLFPRPTLPEIPETAGAGPSTRPLRSTMHAPPIPVPMPDRSESPTPSTPGPVVSKPANGLRIRCIRFGEYDIQTWYDAPFPEEYANMPDGRLWICEFCLKYMKSRFGAGRHQTKCKMRHPPGDEIYRDGPISVFEVDGRKNKIYCQNLCLLSKMFSTTKPFLFYVITEVDESGARFVGYFSKEKRSPKDYNRQGWGQLLIDFSYLLSKKEQRPGSPEKPLSALGALGYKSYWTHSIMRYLRTAPSNPRLEDIGAATSMTLEDIYTTLVQLSMISFDDASAAPRPLPGQTIKFPKGRKNGVARKHLQRMQTQDDIEKRAPFEPPTKYRIHWDPEQNYLKLKPEKLKWSPFIVARTRKTEQLPTDSKDGQGQAKRSGTSQAGEGTQWSDMPATPRPGSSLEGRTTTRSPALALFDDDNVVTASPHPRTHQKASCLTSRWSASIRRGDTPATPTPSRNNVRLNGRGREPVKESPLDVASEEGQPRRQLRPRSNTEQEAKRAISTTPRSASPRKRRRVDSSPEAEIAPTPLRRSLRHPTENEQTLTTTPRLQRKSSRLHASTPTDSDLPSMRPSPPNIPSSSHGEETHDADDEDVEVVDRADAPVHHPAAQRPRVEPDAHAEDLKYEDVDTPMTAMTSRHSVPSDDTVFVEDGGVADKVSPAGQNVDVAMQPPAAAQVALRPAGAMEIEEGGDEDAEGEEDVDAEGEPDVEGEHGMDIN